MRKFLWKSWKQGFCYFKISSIFSKKSSKFVKKVNWFKNAFRAINDVFLGTHLLCNKLRRKEEKHQFNVFLCCFYVHTVYIIFGLIKTMKENIKMKNKNRSTTFSINHFFSHLYSITKINSNEIR